jgi:hypothetical protein
MLECFSRFISLLNFYVAFSWHQRLLTCEQYAISLKLLTVRADPEVIQYHRRYISECKVPYFLLIQINKFSCIYHFFIPKRRV